MGGVDMALNHGVETEQKREEDVDSGFRQRGPKRGQ